MAISTIASTDNGAVSLVKINDNFTDLDTTKADLASPTFTGTPVLPTGTTGVTQSASDNSTKLATTEYVDDAVASVTTNTLTYVEIVPVLAANAGGTSWEDWDLSASIPANALYAEILLHADSSCSLGVRRNGSSAERVLTIGSAAQAGWFNMTVILDANRVIERKTTDIAATLFTVSGYWILA